MKKLLGLALLFIFSISMNPLFAQGSDRDGKGRKPAYYYKAKKKAKENAKYSKMKALCTNENFTIQHFNELETILIGVNHMSHANQANYFKYVSENLETASFKPSSTLTVFLANVFNEDGSMKKRDYYVNAAKELMESNNELDQTLGKELNETFAAADDDDSGNAGNPPPSDTQGDKGKGEKRGEVIGVIVGAVGGFIAGGPEGAAGGAAAGGKVGGFFGKLFSKKKKDEEEEEEETTEGEGEAQGVWAGPNNDEEHYGWPSPF